MRRISVTIAGPLLLALRLEAQPDSLTIPETGLEEAGPAQWEALQEEWDALLLGPVALNRADEQELMRLPGMRPEWAQAILRARAERGGFRSLVELFQIPSLDSVWVARWWPFLILQRRQRGFRGRMETWGRLQPGPQASSRLELEWERIGLLLRGRWHPSSGWHLLPSVSLRLRGETGGLRLFLGVLGIDAGSGLLFGSPYRAIRRAGLPPLFRLLAVRPSVSSRSPWGAWISGPALGGSWHVFVLAPGGWPRSGHFIPGLGWEGAIGPLRLGLAVIENPFLASVYGVLPGPHGSLWGEVIGSENGPAGYLLGGRWELGGIRLDGFLRHHPARVRSPFGAPSGAWSRGRTESGYGLVALFPLRGSLQGWTGWDVATFWPERTQPWVARGAEVVAGIRYRTPVPEGVMLLEWRYGHNPEGYSLREDPLGRLLRSERTERRWQLTGSGSWSLGPLKVRIWTSWKVLSLQGKAISWWAEVQGRIGRGARARLRWGGSTGPGYGIRFFLPEPGPPGEGIWFYGPSDYASLEFVWGFAGNWTGTLSISSLRRGTESLWPSAGMRSPASGRIAIGLRRRWGN
jgi:hypothetical protein